MAAQQPAQQLRVRVRQVPEPDRAIFPSKYIKLRYTQEQWQTLSMCMFKNAEVASYMFETGKADTEAWFAQDYPRYQ